MKTWVFRASASFGVVLKLFQKWSDLISFEVEWPIRGCGLSDRIFSNGDLDDRSIWRIFCFKRLCRIDSDLLCLFYGSSEEASFGMLAIVPRTWKFRVICWIWFSSCALFLVCLLFRLLVLCFRSFNLCHAITNCSEIGNFFSSFLLPRLVSLLRLPFLFKIICYACNSSCIFEISG
jgi:hypothetical protein